MFKGGPYGPPLKFIIVPPSSTAYPAAGKVAAADNPAGSLVDIRADTPADDRADTPADNRAAYPAAALPAPGIPACMSAADPAFQAYPAAIALPDPAAALPAVP